MLFYYHEQKIKKELILIEAFAGIMLGDLGVKAQHGVTCILKQLQGARRPPTYAGSTGPPGTYSPAASESADALPGLGCGGLATGRPAGR